MGPNPMFADSCWLLATLKISPTFFLVIKCTIGGYLVLFAPAKGKKTSSVGIVIPTRIGQIEQIILYPVFFVQTFGAFQSHGGTPHISYPLFPCIFHEIIQKGPHDMVYGDESAIKIPGWVNTHHARFGENNN